jgi:hypothetical protein
MVSLFCPFHGLSKSNEILTIVDLYFVLSGAGLTSFQNKNANYLPGAIPARGLAANRSKIPPHQRLRLGLFHHYTIKNEQIW